LIPRRTFIVRWYEPDRTVVLEDSLTRERVRVTDMSQIGAQLERWLDPPPRDRQTPSDPPFSDSL
jgi:hypothetical protein